ncbi:hypothetical protein Salat_2764600 [Sesamum alatum]|uniref:Retrotransposon gag domain-containing protein n=1 Tax=Sesamum alatum TaxID=300844 RepID=A0AAE1XKB7_9LAMI|nr:hypothetical protein Salat_2764600 [Sesamum alatum]
MNLKQEGTLKDFLDKFDELLNQVDLPETYAVSCLLAGLRGDIAVHVRMFCPKSLQDAICLAKLQEQVLFLASRRTPNTLALKPLSMPSKQIPLLPAPKMTPPPSYPFQSHNALSHYTKTPHQPNHAAKPPPRSGRRLTPQELEEK